jgi:hypothetical protein
VMWIKEIAMSINTVHYPLSTVHCFYRVSIASNSNSISVQSPGLRFQTKNNLREYPLLQIQTRSRSRVLGWNFSIRYS